MELYKVDCSNRSFNFYTLNNCLISSTIRQGKIWEAHLHNIFNKFINKNSTVVECGCHIGTHTVKLASLCDKLIGFEPLPDTYDVLMKNIKVNNIENAFIYKKGVSNVVGSTRYSWVVEGNPGCAGLENNPMGKPTWVNSIDKNIEVELVTIDSLNLDRLDFMKIDVEGYEPLVIEGSMNTIKKFKPVIVMEVWTNHFSGVDIEYTEKLFKNLLDLGYTVTYLEGPDFLFEPIPA